MTTQVADGSLWLTFKLDGMDYCILSDYIESLVVPDKIEPIANANTIMAGLVAHGGALIGVIDMRGVFGRMNLKDYISQFGLMKDMHVSWVEDLTRYVQKGGEFTKAVDPHKCKFGLWYDGFQSDNARLKRLLKKISTPHERIHRCGAIIMELKAKSGDHRAEIEERLAEAEHICNEDIVPMLDRLIEIYRAANRGVILVVNDGDQRAGLLVDEVKTLISCRKTRQQEFTSMMRHSEYVRELVLHGDHVMMEINVERILGKTKNP